MTNFVMNDEKMFADINDGTAIIINGDTGIYYELNPFGTIIYNNLISGVSDEALRSSLLALEGAPSDIGTQLDTFIDQLKASEILIEGNPVEGTPAIELDTAIAGTDDFLMKVTSFNDVQELLLADPIHQVSEETGWEPDKSALNADMADVKRREDKLEA